MLRKFGITIAGLILLVGCAGVADSIRAAATGKDPYSGKSLAAAYLIMIQLSNEAALDYVKSINEIAKTRAIKREDINNLVSRLNKAKAGKDGLVASNVNTAIDNNKEANKAIWEAYSKVEWQKLSKQAQKKFLEAQIDLYSANYFNTDLPIGIVYIARHTSSSALASEVLPALQGKYPGLTLESLMAFPDVVRKFADNISTSYDTAEKGEKVKDFSEAVKARELTNNEKVSKIASAADASLPNKSKADDGGFSKLGL